MNIAQMFGCKVTRDDLDRERLELFNCYECDTPLIGPLCPACNPQGGYTKNEVRVAGIMGFCVGGFVTILFPHLF